MTAKKKPLKAANATSRNERRIREACRKSGRRVESLEWEPITQGCEMEGNYGGWMLNGFPIGYNVDEAIETVETRFPEGTLV